MVLAARLKRYNANLQTTIEPKLIFAAARETDGGGTKADEKDAPPASIELWGLSICQFATHRGALVGSSNALRGSSSFWCSWRGSGGNRGGSSAHAAELYRTRWGCQMREIKREREIDKWKMQQKCNLLVCLCVTEEDVMGRKCKPTKRNLFAQRIGSSQPPISGLYFGTKNMPTDNCNWPRPPQCLLAHIHPQIFQPFPLGCAHVWNSQFFSFKNTQWDPNGTLCDSPQHSMWSYFLTLASWVFL